MLGSGGRAALIANAMDGSAQRRPHRLVQPPEDPGADLHALGIDTIALDLRHYFGRPEALRRALEGIDLVWAADGDVFVLRRAMRQSGFDDLIVELLDEDRLVYGGSGAGAMVVAPCLGGLEAMGDPEDIPQGYDPAPVRDGLGLIDHVLVPHYRSHHPASAAAERTLRHLAARGLRCRALSDGEVLRWTETRHSELTDSRRIA